MHQAAYTSLQPCDRSGRSAWRTAPATVTFSLPAPPARIVSFALSRGKLQRMERSLCTSCLCCMLYAYRPPSAKINLLRLSYLAEKSQRTQLLTQVSRFKLKEAQLAREIVKYQASLERSKQAASTLDAEIAGYRALEDERVSTMQRYAALCSVIAPLISRLDDQEASFGALLRPWSSFNGGPKGPPTGTNASLQIDGYFGSVMPHVAPSFSNATTLPKTPPSNAATPRPAAISRTATTPRTPAMPRHEMTPRNAMTAVPRGSLSDGSFMTRLGSLIPGIGPGTDKSPEPPPKTAPSGPGTRDALTDGGVSPRRRHRRTGLSGQAIFGADTAESIAAVVRGQTKQAVVLLHMENHADLDSDAARSKKSREDFREFVAASVHLERKESEKIQLERAQSQRR